MLSVSKCDVKQSFFIFYLYLFYGELNATLENQSKILERASENITKIQERFLIPTTQFSAYGVVDTSPRKIQTIVYHNVTVNIGHGYNATDSVFTAPAN